MNWTEIIVAFITLVLAPIAVLLTKSILSAMSASTKDTLLQSVIADVETAVPTAADCLTQTVVAELKALSLDGKLTSEDAKAVMKTAVEKAFSMLAQSTIIYIKQQGKDPYEYLEDKIEAYLTSIQRR